MKKTKSALLQKPFKNKSVWPYLEKYFFEVSERNRMSSPPATISHISATMNTGENFVYNSQKPPKTLIRDFKSPQQITFITEPQLKVTLNSNSSGRIDV